MNNPLPLVLKFHDILQYTAMEVFHVRLGELILVGLDYAHMVLERFHGRSSERLLSLRLKVSVVYLALAFDFFAATSLRRSLQNIAFVMLQL